jgi:hypothetical protein
MGKLLLDRWGKWVIIIMVIKDKRPERCNAQANREGEPDPAPVL